jgi:basic amino acid/polyamine antiporter, APA family
MLEENRRDAGLVRAIGVRGLTTSTINTMVGAGIFVTPGALAACMGRSAPVAIILCAIAMGAVTICFAEGGSRVATSGGAYGVIEAAFGPLAGYIAGTLLWLSDALTCGGISAALADVVVSVVPQPFKTSTHMMVIIGVIGAVVIVNLGGVRRGVRLVDWVTTVKIIPLFLFLVVGVTAMHRANFVQTVPSGTQGLGRALILVLFLLTGMEVSLSASGEVEQPSRTIPRALVITLFFVTFLYIAVQIVAQGMLGASLSQSVVPLADAMARISPVLRMVMIAGATVSMLGWIASDLLSSPRILFAFGRDGLLPHALGRVNPRTHAPDVAILCYAALAMGLALTGSFVELAVLATLAVTVLYAAGSVAAWRLARDGVAQNGVPLNFRGLTAAMVVATTSMVIFFAMGSRAEILGVLAVIAVSGTIYVVQTRLALAPARL